VMLRVGKIGGIWGIWAIRLAERRLWVLGFVSKWLLM
jgi:hypothetical protein